MKPTIDAVKRFPVEVRQVESEKGGGWVAEIPALGRYAFSGWGETRDEAFEALYEIAESIIRDYVDEGIELPDYPADPEYSGNFMTRSQKRLHASLVTESAMQGVSLNQYVNSILERRHTPQSQHRIDQIMIRLDTLTSLVSKMHASGWIGIAVKPVPLKVESTWQAPVKFDSEECHIAIYDDVYRSDDPYIALTQGTSRGMISGSKLFRTKQAK